MTSILQRDGQEAHLYMTERVAMTCFTNAYQMT